MSPDESTPITRIMVYGVTGSGKTTLAERIGKQTNLPWHSVDDLTWDPGWVQVPVETQRERITAICEQDKWVIDTAYGQWIDIPLARVQLIVGLDYPRWVSLGRLLRRTFSRVIDKKMVCNGNTETWRNMFSYDSIIAWHFRSFSRKRARIRQWASSTTGPTVVHITHPRQLEAWLASFPTLRERSYCTRLRY